MTPADVQSKIQHALYRRAAAVALLIDQIRMARGEYRRQGAHLENPEDRRYAQGWHDALRWVEGRLGT